MGGLHAGPASNLGLSAAERCFVNRLVDVALAAAALRLPQPPYLRSPAEEDRRRTQPLYLAQMEHPLSLAPPPMTTCSMDSTGLLCTHTCMALLIRSRAFLRPMMAALTGWADTPQPISPPISCGEAHSFVMQPVKPTQQRAPLWQSGMTRTCCTDGMACHGRGPAGLCRWTVRWAEGRRRQQPRRWRSHRV